MQELIKYCQTDRQRQVIEFIGDFWRTWSLVYRGECE